jgi:phenylalanyl-tRNA synthetase alpha chain
VGVLKSLETHAMVSFSTHETERWILTSEGQEILEKGSHEAKVFNLIPPGPDKNKWIDRRDGNRLIRKVDHISDETRTLLQEISEKGSLLEREADLRELKKRKLVDCQRLFSYSISKGSQFARQLEKPSTDLTSDILLDRSWTRCKFKKYNYDALGLPTTGGHLHPLLKVREEFRQIFFEMGFVEMPTNQYVESSFWNFDALFQPQQHPARDAHDTFFLTAPERCTSLPEDYLQQTRKVHQEGGYGSIGYKCEWHRDETEKNILRTHTTAVSSRMLYKLAQQKTFKPAKYFSIDKVFRNETVDATHLAEFHQIEGLVADHNLTLGDLIGTLQAFFAKLGLSRLRFKPAYNPYTEPSMEVFAYHEGLCKWIEVGNSGVFRPEMLRPMGFAEDVSVIAWGLSLERPTMIKYGVSNIRDLLGHKVDLAMVMSNPVCRLDKH